MADDAFGGIVRISVAGDPSGDPTKSALLARNWWAFALRGILGIAFGSIAFAWPIATMLSLALFFAAYLLADGALGIVAAVRAARAHERWGLLLAEGLLNIAMGLVAAFFPGGAVVAFVIVTAAWALLTGALMLMAAFRLNKAHGSWWLAFGGIASLLWGLLLVLAPLAGAVVLTWWLGCYAFVFGVFLLIVSVKLRSELNRSVEPASAPIPNT